MIEIGDKVHIISRRFFENDIRRHFAGEVIGVSEGLQEVRGYAFVSNRGTIEYHKRPELRTRIVSFGQANYIVNKIPRAVAIDSLEYRLIEKHLVVTDNLNFALDINEFGHLI
jgi:hypothetical protein